MLAIKAVNSDRYVQVATAGKNAGRFEYVQDIDDATTFTNSIEAIHALQARERSLGIDIGRGKRKSRKTSSPTPKDAFGLVQVSEEEREVTATRKVRSAAKNF